MGRGWFQVQPWQALLQQIELPWWDFIFALALPEKGHSRALVIREILIQGFLFLRSEGLNLLENARFLFGHQSHRPSHYFNYSRHTIVLLQ
jgi:hypothetical protein